MGLNIGKKQYQLHFWAVSIHHGKSIKCAKNKHLDSTGRKLWIYTFMEEVRPKIMDDYELEFSDKSKSASFYRSMEVVTEE